MFPPYLEVVHDDVSMDSKLALELVGTDETLVEDAVTEVVETGHFLIQLLTAQCVVVVGAAAW